MASGNFIDSYRLVQLAAYPDYDGKDDQDRERHGDAAPNAQMIMISQIVTTWLVFSRDQHWWLCP